MASAERDVHLKAWIKEQYSLIGLDKNGAFIGKKLFKPKLAAQKCFPDGEIDQALNE
jgi:hypothetical protein